MNLDDISKQNIIHAFQSTIYSGDVKLQDIEDPEIKVRAYISELARFKRSMLLEVLLENRPQKKLMLDSVTFSEDEMAVNNCLLEVGFTLKQISDLKSNLTFTTSFSIFEILDPDIIVENDDKEEFELARNYFTAFLANKISELQIETFIENITSKIQIAKNKTYEERVKSIEDLLNNHSELNSIYSEYKLLRNTSTTLSGFALVIARIVLQSMQALDVDIVNNILIDLTSKLALMAYDNRDFDLVKKDFITELESTFQLKDNAELVELINQTVKHLSGKMLPLAEVMTFDSFNKQMVEGVKVLCESISDNFELGFDDKDNIKKTQFGNPDKKNYTTCVAVGTSMSFIEWLKDLLKERGVIES